jgi:hypothetical protein
MNNSGPKSGPWPCFSWANSLLPFAGHKAVVAHRGWPNPRPEAAEAALGQRHGGARAGAGHCTQGVSGGTASDDGRGDVV